MKAFSATNSILSWCLLGVALALWASPAAASSVGSIGVFGDPGGGSCDITDELGIVTAEVVMVNSQGATHVSFIVEESPGVAMTYTDETVHFALKLGDTRTGIQITFGACRSGSVHLATVRYSGTGTTGACGEIRVMPHPSVGSVRIYDCEQNAYTVESGGAALVRNDGGCGCNVATEASTWGRIKSLYR